MIKKITTEPIQEPLQKINKEPIQKKESPLTPLPLNLIEKIKSFTKGYSKNEILCEFINNRAIIILPQSYIFGSESIAMSQQGTDLILKMCTLLRPFQNNLHIDILSFHTRLTNPELSNEISIKRANTLNKVMNVSGIRSHIAENPFVTKQINRDRNIPGEGIEISIYVE